MKVKNKKDSLNSEKKIVLIENITFSSGYDIARDSLNWNLLGINAYTKLFKNIDLRFAGYWDPYVIDTFGVRLDKFERNENNRWFRKKSTDWSLSLNWNLSSNKINEKNKSEADKNTESIRQNPQAYIDFDNPWSINLYYTFRYTNVWDQYEIVDRKTVQTLSVNGDVSVTKKWKVGFTTGYDFQNKELSYTSLEIYRDLHCWEMLINWIPFGFRKSYNLTIRVKSPILQDLKLTKKTDWRDY